MIRLFFQTYISLIIIYVWIYSIDKRIVYPYKPFKLKKLKNRFSKYLIFCNDRNRGMINITFYLQMLAHIFSILFSVALIFIYCRKLYQISEFCLIYKDIIVVITTFVFIIPLTVAGAIYDRKNR